MHAIISFILAFTLLAAFDAPPTLMSETSATGKTDATGKTGATVETSEAARLKELEALLERAAAADTFSGAVLVARDGTPVFKKAYGMANQEKRAANHTDTKFNLGSMNKMFTSVAVAQLAERGKLSYDDTIAKHLPDYPDKEVAAKVTIHQLLTHTSGLGNYMTDAWVENRAKIKTVADLLPYFAAQPLKFAPGTSWQYSNAGFVVLGLIVEKLSGQSYYDYVRAHIFKPAGMRDTDSYESTSDVANLAVGYTRMGADGRGRPENPRRPNTFWLPFKGSPAGGGYSTLEDMLKFDRALRTHKLLNAKFTELITQGKVDAPFGKYAYGFGDSRVNGKRYVGHNGGAPGTAAQFESYTDTGYTLVVLANYDPPAVMPLIREIEGIVTKD
ncbi:MAG TPA: serine hydrolase domain-containing protein [Pyrinomonadaceae bacterium]|jgi:CubicO group peptidase (beta-lactamase class C family)|nr:serine hydrolase domain-containing protein [Pyrinomonadaceae bacterium]